MEGQPLEVNDLVAPPPVKEDGRGKSPSSQANLRPNLGTFVDKEKAREAGRKGALVTNAKRKEKREASQRMIEDAMREAAEASLEKLIAPYFKGLELQPDPNWSPRTKLEFYLEQSTLSEKVASRLEGLPVARRREVDVDGNDRDKVNGLNMGTLTRALAGALGTGQVDLEDVDQIEAAPEDVVEIDAD